MHVDQLPDSATLKLESEFRRALNGERRIEVRALRAEIAATAATALLVFGIASGLALHAGLIPKLLLGVGAGALVFNIVWVTQASQLRQLRNSDRFIEIATKGDNVETFAAAEPRWLQDAIAREHSYAVSLDAVRMAAIHARTLLVVGLVAELVYLLIVILVALVLS